MPEPQNTYNRHAGPDPASPRHCGLDRHAELDSASPRHCGLDPQSHWYAARLTASAALFLKRLAHDGIHSYRTQFAPGIVFLRCTAGYASQLLSDYWGKLYFYLDTEHKLPAPISEKEMNNFILVTSVSDEIIPLSDVTDEFLKGDRVRVTAGLFEGAEGVVKRIKGDHRLVVSINSFVAVATCFIRPEFLEKI